MTFTDIALRYLDAGYAPIPLPPGEKHPPPTGFTGRNGKRADAAQIASWTKKYGKDANAGVWFGPTVTVDGEDYQLAGIDVDHYGDKRGGDQLQSLENELGPLSAQSAPWISSARTDGISGIRWFRVPLEDSDGKRIELRGKADEAIEVIQYKHRYAVVWPSINPKTETEYWWFPPAVALTEDGKTGPASWRETDELPDPKTFPVLSDRWVTYLREHRSHTGKIDLSIGVDDLYQWATDVFNDGGEDALCWNIATALNTWKRKITEDESSHDKITDAHWMLYSLAAEGHTGWQYAVTEIEQHWADSVSRSGKRDPREAGAEMFRSKTGALRKIKFRVESDGVRTDCDCAGIGSNLWHSHNVPLAVARQFALAIEREETPLRFWRDDWYQYNGIRWETLHKDGLRKLLYERLESAKYLNASGDLMPWNPTDRKISSVEHALKAVVLLRDSLDAPRWLDDGLKGMSREYAQMIAFQNTLLRVQDRQEFDHTPTYFNLNALPFDYKPSAERPVRWLKFLRELWPEDAESIDLLQEWFGYVLSGQTNRHKMLMLLGPKRSGKSTIIYVLRLLVGNESYTETRSNDFVGSFGMAGLIGRTLAVFDDDRIARKDAELFVDRLKNIIGEGYTEINRKYKEPWCGRLGARFVYTANELSALPDASGALPERMLLLETVNSFAANPDIDLRNKLAAELPGIFNWALDGLDRLNRTGKFTEPHSSRGLRQEIEHDASPVKQFIEDKCLLDEGGFVGCQTLYDHWQLWCENAGLQPGSRNLFARRLRAAYGGQLSDGKRGPAGNQKRVYVGVRLR